MIEFSHVTKHYGSECVLRERNDHFGDHGFFLLLGESGSGKTTFLNVLFGLLPFDAGTITVDGVTYNGQVDRETISQKADYITQDPFFVDFLTAEDNLRMVCDDREAIRAEARRFGLEPCLDQLPATLSGGEQQRLAVIRSLLRGKKILLLDEPTAALDAENKKKLFGFLASLKDQALILCASHDQVASDYADAVVSFDKGGNRDEEAEAGTENGTCAGELPAETLASELPRKEAANSRGVAEKDPRPWLRRWFRSTGLGGMLGKAVLILFLLTASILYIYADTPKHKMDSVNAYVYHLTFVEVITDNYHDWDELCPSWEDVRKVVLDYRQTCPDGNENTGFEVGVPGTGPDYELDFALTVPFEAEYFPLAKRIVYGTYFTGENQIILTWEAAKLLRPYKPERLIGETLQKTFYGLGTLDMEVVGILGELSEEEKWTLDQFGTSRGIYDHYYFINSKLTDRLAADPSFYYRTRANGRRHYNIYFDSYFDAQRYYKRYLPEAGTGADYTLQFVSSPNLELYQDFQGTFPVLMPLSILVSVLALLFYLQLRKMEYDHRHRFISAFEYDGYNKKRVIRDFLLLNIRSLLRCILAAAGSALLITAAVNRLNAQHHWVPYLIFSYNLPLLLAYFIGMLLFGALFTWLFYRKVRVMSWYEDLIDTRDLL